MIRVIIAILGVLGTLVLGAVCLVGYSAWSLGREQIIQQDRPVSRETALKEVHYLPASADNVYYSFWGQGFQARDYLYRFDIPRGNDTFAAIKDFEANVDGPKDPPANLTKIPLTRVMTDDFYPRALPDWWQVGRIKRGYEVFSDRYDGFHYWVDDDVGTIYAHYAK